ncbi:hypothetical protein [Mesorhizobium kowhaii]|uniref:Uncharacterized protein n=1 Tax=Mesorhizobium kowhaii TaxID=1300272 RepID=A0A2W7CAV1_9HYPH|nr:hypothetical protein [Mesorhizobium kowhaii]PZV40167.1 hypothetical protein B5V02_02125 [Mesorhizobium kowhaii]
MKIRSKMRITSITPYPPTPEGTPTQETLKFHAVAKDGRYPSDGSDEAVDSKIRSSGADAERKLKSICLGITSSGG